MRPIKFRVWTGAGMEYSVGVSKSGNFYDAGIDPRDRNCLRTTLYSDTAPVMQFTGLKDKHEKDIFEGDFVRFTGFFGIGAYEEKVEAAVRFSHGSFVAGFIRDWQESEKDLNSFFYQPETRYVPNVGEVRDRSHTPLFDLEVIGNIYENPELLEAKAA